MTEAVYPGLDIVELMIRQGLAELESESPGGEGGLAPSELDQAAFIAPPMKHAIEARIYAENPIPNAPPATGTGFTFQPSPGILQFVDIPVVDGIRVDTWVRLYISVSRVIEVSINGLNTLYDRSRRVRRSARCTTRFSRK